MVRADIQESREAYVWGVYGLVSRYYDYECEGCGLDGYIRETFEGGPRPVPDRFFYKDVEPDAHRVECWNCGHELGS